jgi:hypothetical protein
VLLTASKGASLFVAEIGERAQAGEPRPNSPGRSNATYAMRPQRRYRGLNACHSPTATDASTPFFPIQAAEIKTNRMDRYTASLIRGRGIRGQRRGPGRAERRGACSASGPLRAYETSRQVASGRCLPRDVR